MAKAGGRSGGKGGGSKSEAELHSYSEDLAASVRTLAGLGLTDYQIGYYHGLTTDTIRQHYGEEARVGEAQANAKVAGALFAAATNPQHKAQITAAIWWTKARMGWQEPAGAPEKGNGWAGPAAPPAEGDAEPAAEEFDDLMDKLKSA